MQLAQINIQETEQREQNYFSLLIAKLWAKYSQNTFE